MTSTTSTTNVTIQTRMLPAHAARQVSRSAGSIALQDPDYSDLIAKALVADRFDLDTFPVLSELPAVERFAEAHPHALLPRGKALQLLLARAIGDVTTAYVEDADRTLRKIAAYVRLRYGEGNSVTEIAEAWGLDRTVVSRQLSRRSLQVVAHRFLQLAEHMRWEQGDGKGDRA